MRLEKTEADITMQIGDKVEILDGALKGQVGTIKEIDKENLMCKVCVEMFGRENNIDVNLDEVRKLL